MQKSTRQLMKPEVTFTLLATLPQTNGSLPKRKVVFQPSIFRFYVCFREGTASKNIKEYSRHAVDENSQRCVRYLRFAPLLIARLQTFQEHTKSETQQAACQMPLKRDHLTQGRRCPLTANLNIPSGGSSKYVQCTI